MPDKNYLKLTEAGFTREQANAIIDVVFEIVTPEDY